MKKVLVTGSSGFVGSYFINKYNDKYNIKKFSFLKDDIAKLYLEDIDVIIHLSALVHQMGGAKRSEYDRVNVGQTLELAKRAKESGVRHFIFMSSVKVYGEENDLPYTENTPCRPEDEYGKSKLKAERELQELEDENFTVSIIRTPIVYGKGVKANIANLITLIKKAHILPFKNIKNLRSMVYIGNLAQLIDELIIQHKSGIFLAGDTKPVSTSKLIDAIAEELGKKLFMIEIPFFEYLLQIFKPNIHKRLYGSLQLDNSYTFTVLNYSNKYTFQEGIKYMIHGEDI